jgi:hypothetical protein
MALAQLSNAVRQKAEQWAIERDYAIRWYHAWRDGDRWMVTAYAEDAANEGHVFTVPSEGDGSP